MKAVLEFGIRGGYHTDNLVIPSAKLAASLAKAIAQALMDEECTTCFLVARTQPRISLTSSKHFVSVTLLDGVARGPASTDLWRQP